MKRLILTISAILCLASPAYAWMGVTMVGGGGGATGCVETTPDSQSTQDGMAQLGISGRSYLQTPFTAAGVGTYKVQTIYVKLLKIGDPNASGFTTITVALCATTNGTTQTGSCTDIGTISTSDLTTSYANYKLNYTTGDGYSLTNGTVYHIRLAVNAEGDASNYVRWGKNDAGFSGVYYDSDGAGNYNTVDADAQGDFVLKNCVE